jgi:hypothetical protein
MSTAPRVAIVAAIACALLESACNALFSVSGYAGSDDGSAPAADGGATSDAGTNETGVMPADSSVADVFCPPGAILCDDFNRPSSDLLGTIWGSASTAGTTNIVLVDASPSGHALQCEDDVLDAGVEVVVDKVTTAVVTQTATMHFGANLTAGPTGGVHLNELVFHNGDAYGFSIVFLYVNYGNLQISELVCPDGVTCQYNGSTASTPFSMGVWHELSLTVDFGPSSPATYKARLDGVEIDSTSASGAMPGPVEIHGGAVVDPNAGNVDLLIDQLVVTGQ